MRTGGVESLDFPAAKDGWDYASQCMTANPRGKNSSSRTLHFLTNFSCTGAGANRAAACIIQKAARISLCLNTRGELFAVCAKFDVLQRNLSFEYATLFSGRGLWL
jgi:hypothetical protein